jgi:hypothetical protein
MTIRKPAEPAEVLRKLKERLESDDEDFSDEERYALDYAVHELRQSEGYPERPRDF